MERRVQLAVRVLVLTLAVVATAVWFLGCKSQQPAGGGPGAGPGVSGRGPGGPGGPGGRGPMSDADRARMREEMLQRALDQSGLTDEEKALAKAAADAKDQARQTLRDALTEFRRAVNAENPSEADLKAAMETYQKALAKYRQDVAAQDEALKAKLSPAAQARCLSLGILDNGLGMAGMFGGGREGGGEGRPGG